MNRNAPAGSTLPGSPNAAWRDSIDTVVRLVSDQLRRAQGGRLGPSQDRRIRFAAEVARGSERPIAGWTWGDTPGPDAASRALIERMARGELLCRRA